MNLFNFLKEEEIYKNQTKKFEYIENNLKYLYDNPVRSYHNLFHVEDCLKEFEECSKYYVMMQESTKIIIKLALIYHDCVYNPQNTNNEELSAQRAYIDLESLHCEYYFNPHIINTSHLVYNYILDTKHDKKPCDEYSKIICDIDLSILGRDYDVFRCYDWAISLEYSFTPTKKYYENRIDFLNSLINKESIYHTDHFKRKYEEIARLNIKRKIEEIKETYRYLYYINYNKDI